MHACVQVKDLYEVNKLLTGVVSGSGGMSYPEVHDSARPVWWALGGGGRGHKVLQQYIK